MKRFGIALCTVVISFFSVHTSVVNGEVEQNQIDLNNEVLNTDEKNEELLDINNEEGTDVDTEIESVLSSDESDELEDDSSENRMVHENDNVILSEGMESDQVTELKLMIKKVKIGNYPEDPSIKFGDSTTRNVKEFQSYFPDLRQDGVVDLETWNKLESIVNSEYQNGKKG